MRNRYARSVRAALKSLSEAFLRRRWLLVFLLAASALLFEIWEHQGVENPIDSHYIREVVFFGVIYPLAAVFLLNHLLRVQEERNYILRQKEIEKKLSEKLISASDWDDLCRRIVDFPTSITPVVGVSLFSFSADTNGLTLESEWWLVDSLRLSTLQKPLPIDYCGITDHSEEQHMHQIVSEGIRNAPFTGYCIPLFLGESWLGLLLLFLPSKERLSTDQINILTSVQPILSLAFDTANLSTRFDARTMEIQDERERIARQLHDTLGQNLAYLRLKLDQMSAKNMLNELVFLQQDLERMRDIAQESHEQVRRIMASMKSEAMTNLTELLLTQTQVIAEQAGFIVQTRVSGESVKLKSTVQRKINAIFREALFNVHRHANANIVQLTIIWDAPSASLTITLEDDGIGFDMDQPSEPDHFGLLIMQQRAEEIKGQFRIISYPSKGTQVTLYYPLSQTPPMTTF